MAALLQFIATHMMFLFDSGRYRIVDSRSGRPSGDGFVVIESTSVRLRLVHDRSQMHIDIQPRADGSEEWFGVGIARRWLLGEHPGYDYLDESSVTFLRQYLDRIEADWSTTAGCEAGLQRLREERAARADELFGGPGQ